MKVELLTAELQPLIHAFENKLNASGGNFHFPVEKNAGHYQATADIYFETFGTFSQETLCGIHTIKYQSFFCKQEKKCQPIGMYQYPVSLGIMDTRFGKVGAVQAMTAEKHSPNLFALGMGGFHNDLPKLLTAMGWWLMPVAFYFKIKNPYHFCKDMQYLRKTRTRRLLLDLLAYTGTASLGHILFNCIKQTPKMPSTIAYKRVPAFDDSVNMIWEKSKQDYDFIAQRDQDNLNYMFPKLDPRFHRLYIYDKQRGLIGWVAIAISNMHQDKYFGNLKLATIADGLAKPDDIPLLLAAASHYIDGHAVDLIVSNQSHHSWQHAFAQYGFLSGPSNYIFAGSKKLKQTLASLSIDNMYLNRGDCDGPIHI